VDWFLSVREKRPEFTYTAVLWGMIVRRPSST
jgi:hypothetical protein